MMDTKIKQDQICIGKNIREIRISKGMGQTELVRRTAKIDTMEMYGVEGVTMEFKAFQLIIGNQIPTTNEILSIVVYGKSIYRSATDNSIVREA